MTQEVSRMRMEGFEPFRTITCQGLGSLNYKSLLTFSDEDFAERYLGEMTRYFFEHGKKLLEMEVYKKSVGINEGLRPVSCSGCLSPIGGPRDMVRYYGNTLHSGCFINRWGKDKRIYVATKGKDLEFQYWERITAMILKRGI